MHGIDQSESSSNKILLSRKIALHTGQVTAALVCLTSLIVITGWYTHSTHLIQLHESFPPMQFNTALCFLLSGLGLYSLHSNANKIGCYLSTPVLILGLLTLFEYKSGIKLGIDEIFMEGYIGTLSPESGRMSPNTAIAFGFTGISLLLFLTSRQASIIMLSATLLAASIFGIALTSLFGYVTSLSTAYGWNSGTGMAIHTSFSFLLLGTGLIAKAIPKDNNQKQIRKWIFMWLTPLIISTGLCVNLALQIQFENLFLPFTLNLSEQSLLDSRLAPLQNVVQTFIILILLLLMLLLYAFFNVLDNRRKVSDLYQKQSSAIDTMLDAMVIISARGIIQEVNQTMLTQFGYKRDEVIDQNVAMLMPEPYQHEHNDYIKSYQKTHNAKIIGKNRTLRAVRKDGSEFPIQLEVTEGSFEGEIFYTGVIRDLTDIMNSREQLVEKQALLDAAVKKSGLAFAIVNEGRFTECNDTLCEWLGYSHENMLGMYIEKVLYDSQNNLYDEIIDHFEKNNTTNFRAERCFLDQNDNQLWGLISATYIDSLNCFVLNIVDINKEKQLSIEIEKRNQALEKINAELDHFAYVASHDLKEPLRTMNTFSSHLVKDLEKGRDDRVQEDITFIQSSSERMTNLIDDLLQYSRTSHVEFYLEQVSLVTCIKNVCRELQTLIQETNAEIIISENLPVVIVDKIQISRVFINLINNAIKFQKDGSRPIININFTEAPDTGQAAIVVTDNGIGIDEEHYNTIFTAFKKLHRHSEYAGTGIGLAVVKKIIERHGGDISVMSNKNEGTSFYITLPELTAYQGDYHVKKAS